MSLCHMVLWLIDEPKHSCKKAPDDEDWKSCHPGYGTPLMATMHNAIVCPGGKQLGNDIRSVAVAVCQLVASAQIFMRPH